MEKILFFQLWLVDVDLEYGGGFVINVFVDYQVTFWRVNVRSYKFTSLQVSSCPDLNSVSNLSFLNGWSILKLLIISVLWHWTGLSDVYFSLVGVSSHWIDWFTNFVDSENYEFLWWLLRIAEKIFKIKTFNWKVNTLSVSIRYYSEIRVLYHIQFSVEYYDVT